MKRIKVIILIFLFCICACSCSNTAQNGQDTDHVYSRIVVLDSKTYSTAFHYRIGEYEDLQVFLDETVDRYNKNHNNEDLYKICLVIGYSECFKNGDAIVVEYYSKFFKEIEKDNKFDKETKESQKEFACVLATALYFEGNQMESIEFFNKYLDTIEDVNDKIIFTSDCYENYFCDYAPKPSKEFLNALLKTAKELEEKYDDKVNDMNRCRIYDLIYLCYDKLGNTEMAKEYFDKVGAIIKSWSDDYLE